MTIWVDADACPRALRTILFRAADRLQIRTTLVANATLEVPHSPNIGTLRVPQGLDEADKRIAELVQPDDLVVTNDIPLAAAVVERGATALDHRGELLTADNVYERLATRDLLTGLRDAGVDIGGPSAFSASDKMAFANGLDRFLTGRQRD